MPNNYYIREANHERKIIEEYNKLGFIGIRSAGSKGGRTKEHPSLIDLIVWNEEYFVLIASQHVPWNIQKQEWIWKTLKRPKNTYLIFRGQDYDGRETIEDGDELAIKYGWKK